MGGRADTICKQADLIITVDIYINGKAALGKAVHIGTDVCKRLYQPPGCLQDHKDQQGNYQDGYNRKYSDQPIAGSIHFGYRKRCDSQPAGGTRHPGHGNIINAFIFKLHAAGIFV